MRFFCSSSRLPGASLRGTWVPYGDDHGCGDATPASVLARGGRAIDRYQYLLLMAACLVVTLPLEFVLGAHIYRRFRPVLWALVPVALVFSIWDVAGIARHHWSYNPRFVTGVTLGFGMPVEELVFFLVIPVCGLLTYEAVGCTLARVRRLRTR